ncbi:MAG: conjugative transposon protein TraM [Candidatus Amoebophilus sp.]
MKKKQPLASKTTIAVGAFILVLCTIILFSSKGEDKANSKPLFKDLKLKPEEMPSDKKSMSKYDRIKEEQENPHQKNSLSRRVKTIKTSPLLVFHTKKEPAKPSPIEEPQKKEQPAAVKKEDSSATKRGFFGASNTELYQGERFFKATFRETQQVQSGKALRIILEEDIPELRLEQGITLKGVPSFSGDRIIIHITAGIVGDEIKRLDLICFDQEDYLEGVYHDELAKQLEEATKESLLDEVLDLDFKGNRIARKANNLTKFYKNITIQKGKEIFVAIPPKIEEDRD